jgi:hypothetical protein
MEIKTGPTKLGAVASVRGSVVDVPFNRHLPTISSVLHAETTNNVGNHACRKAIAHWLRVGLHPIAPTRLSDHTHGHE